MNIKFIFGLTLVAGALASCSVEEQELPAEELYAREFYKNFGQVNENQDWSVVEQKSINVKSVSPVKVEIFEKQGNVYKLAANYSDVQGTKTITFDGVEGDNTPFIVSIDGNMMVATNGQTIDYKGNTVSGIKRASVIPTNDQWLSHNTTATSLTLGSDDNVLSNLTSRDKKDNSMVVTPAKANAYMDNLTEDQSATYYPVYNGYDGELTFGIFYYDINTGKTTEVPMYKTSGDKEFTALNNGSLTSYGYNINPNQNALIGFYVTDGTKTYYSNAALNNGEAHFGYRTENNGTFGNSSSSYTYLAIDFDGDDDYNDLVFVTPRVINPVAVRDQVSWLVACEDLGNTDDFDFNDIVFRVYHLGGTDYLTIVPVAAGGTLQAWLCYGEGENDCTELSNEWHQHFYDQSNNIIKDYTTMINTYAANQSNKIVPIRVTGLPNNWSMKAFTQDPNAQDGNFFIKVKRNDGTMYSVTAPQNGKAPQMLILKSDWQWPTERTRITTAYSGFGEWGENYINSSWADTPAEGTTIKMTDTEFTSNGKMKNVDLSK